MKKKHLTKSQQNKIPAKKQAILTELSPPDANARKSDNGKPPRHYKHPGIYHSQEQLRQGIFLRKEDCLGTLGSCQRLFSVRRMHLQGGYCCSAEACLEWSHFPMRNSARLMTSSRTRLALCIFLFFFSFYAFSAFFFILYSHCVFP